jgi:DNA-3-methyladenine glycosylase I
MMYRCPWCSGSLMIAYHDCEWGFPLHDDIKLFEFLVLEGAQAGLSWSTIFNKRSAYQIAFDGFDPLKVAMYDDFKIESLINNPGIVRNKRKISSAVRNANVFLSIQDKFGSFDAYIWGFVNGKQIVNQFKTLSEIPAETELSKKISKDLIHRGMNFVGPTIMYAFMQAVGLVNDHLVNCFRYVEINENTQEKK